MADLMDKFAEFVCWTIPTRTQNAGEFTYFCPTGAAFRSRCL